MERWEEDEASARRQLAAMDMRFGAGDAAMAQ